MRYHVYLQENDGTWRPCADKSTLDEAAAYGDRQGVNYNIEYNNVIVACVRGRGTMPKNNRKWKNK